MSKAECSVVNYRYSSHCGEMDLYRRFGYSIGHSIDGTTSQSNTWSYIVRGPIARSIPNNHISETRKFTEGRAVEVVIKCKRFGRPPQFTLGGCLIYPSGIVFSAPSGLGRQLIGIQGEGRRPCIIFCPRRLNDED